MLKIWTAGLGLLFLIPVGATTKSDSSCRLLLASDAPVVTPDRPIAPSRPDVEPAEPVPRPRRAPNPLPGRPLQPTEDPKDLIPVELYEQDGEMGAYWKGLAPDVRATLTKDADEDLRRLSAEFERRYGERPNINVVYSNIIRVLRAVEPIERRHKIAIESVVRQLVENRFGGDTALFLKTSISDQLPARPDGAPESGQIQRTDPLLEFLSPQQNIDPKLMKFYALRREFYNLIAQAEGWNGMSEFVRDRSRELYLIDLRLPSLYAELDLNYRLATRLMVQRVTRVQSVQGTDVRGQITAGREIVCIHCRPVQGMMGEKEIEIASISGIAVGKNGWALAHEAYKAAFQMATALEATQRAPLNSTERQILDDLTNSNAAEIRQGIFGPGFLERMRRFVNALTGTTDQRHYFVIIERVFSLLPENLFHEFILDVARFDPAKMPIESFRRKYNEFLLPDEFL